MNLDRTRGAGPGDGGGVCGGGRSSGARTLVNENTGVNGNGATAARGTGFDELPYFQEYLQAILRPKIEKTMETLDRLLTEAAWRHIIATVAAEQHLSAEVASTVIRPLLEQKLGLKIQVKLESQFANSPPSLTGDVGDGVAKPVGTDAEVLTVRRRPMNNPIANAVASNPRPMQR